MKGSIKTTSILLLVGAFGLAIAWHFTGDNSATATEQSVAPQPLYWVAPMDPNYRRAQPGKSPMGMDLVPVFADNDASTKGVVRIDPAVVNNLGVRTAPVVIDVLPSRFETVGYVQFDENKLTHIHPRVEGWIEQLFVTAAGDPVVAGEPLYAMYSPTLVNAQEELLLALTRENAVLIDAARERLATLQVPATAIARIESVREIARTITVDVPKSGVLNDLFIREGMYVKPGMELMSIAGLDQIWIIGEVIESQAGKVQQGDSVTVALDVLPGRSWQGRVDYIYPVLNTVARTLRIRVEISNDDLALRPGMFAQLTIEGVAQQPTLIIPREALIRTGAQDRVVLALDAGRFKSIEVQVGAVVGQQVEILSGLAAGEMIVTSAQFLIDSESSKSSDFKRLETPPTMMSHAAMSTSMPMSMPAGVAHQDHTMQSAMNVKAAASPTMDAKMTGGEQAPPDQDGHEHHPMMHPQAVPEPTDNSAEQKVNDMADHQGMGHMDMQMDPEVDAEPVLNGMTDHPGMDHSDHHQPPAQPEDKL